MTSVPLSADNPSLFVKQWLRKYGLFIAIAVAVILAIVLGTYYSYQHKQNQIERASDFYQQLVMPAHGTAVPWTFVDELKNHYSNTPYAALAVLLHASHSVKQNNFSAALSDYQWVMDHGHWLPAKQIARLNVARIYLFQNHPEKALQTLSVVEDKAYQPMIDELQGDIARQKSDKEKAFSFYQKAKDGFKAIGVSNTDLDLKINHVRP